MKKSASANSEKQNKKGNLLILLVPALIFLVGAGIFLYPAISNLFAEYQQRTIVEEYETVVNQSSAETLAEAWAEAERYNEDLGGDPVHDPFVLGSGYTLSDDYERVLNLGGDGVMGYIEINKIGVYLPIYHGSSEEVLSKGAGHIESTALPIGGEYRHSVISAHRGLPSAELFSRLDEMEEGDVFYIHVLGETLAYEVDQITVIEPEQLSDLQPEVGKDYVTLLTCTPYGINTHRLLVRGTRIPYEQAIAQNTGHVYFSLGWWREYLWAILLGVGLLLLLLIFLIVRRRKKKKEKQEGQELSPAGEGAPPSSETASAPEDSRPPPG